MNVSECRLEANRAKDALSSLLLDLGTKEVREQIPGWPDLYYTNTHLATTYRTRGSVVVGALLLDRPQAASQVNEAVKRVVVALREFSVARSAAKSAPKPASAPSTGSSRSSLPSLVALPLTEPARPGTRLVLRYGNGTQLFEVTNISPRGRLCGQRLFGRGTPYPRWRRSNISPSDSRILGRWDGSPL